MPKRKKVWVVCVCVRVQCGFEFLLVTRLSQFLLCVKMFDLIVEIGGGNTANTFTYYLLFEVLTIHITNKCHWRRKIGPIVLMAKFRLHKVP